VWSYKAGKTLVYVLECRLPLKKKTQLCAGRTGRSENAGPRVEHLNHLRPGLDLEDAVGGDVVGELGQQGMKQLRLGEHHALDSGVALGRAALDAVRGQGVGRAHKAQHGRLVAHLGAQVLQRLAHKGGRLLKVDVAADDGVDVGLGLERRIDHRALVRNVERCVGRGSIQNRIVSVPDGNKEAKRSIDQGQHELQLRKRTNVHGRQRGEDIRE
jgi:hypothetical protein